MPCRWFGDVPSIASRLHDRSAPPTPRSGGDDRRAAIPIAILLPSLGAARAAARRTQCLAQVRQIAVAQVAYASEDRVNRLPFDYLAGVTWDDLLANLTGRVLDATGQAADYAPRHSADALYRCPSDPTASWLPATNRRTYAMIRGNNASTGNAPPDGSITNHFGVIGPHADNTDGWSISRDRLTEPSNTYLLTEREQGQLLGNVSASSANSPAEQAVTLHQRSATYLYADAHALAQDPMSSGGPATSSRWASTWRMPGRPSRSPAFG